MIYHGRKGSKFIFTLQETRDRKNGHQTQHWGRSRIFFCYPFSQNHGSVENHPKWKEFLMFEIHIFSTEPWLSEEVFFKFFLAGDFCIVMLHPEWRWVQRRRSWALHWMQNKKTCLGPRFFSKSLLLLLLSSISFFRVGWFEEGGRRWLLHNYSRWAPSFQTTPRFLSYSFPSAFGSPDIMKKIVVSKQAGRTFWEIAWLKDSGRENFSYIFSVFQFHCCVSS